MKPDQHRPNRGLLVEFLDWIGFLGLIYGPLDRRLSFRAALDLAVKKPVVNLPVWACFGGIALFLFVVQVATGLLLLLYYIPSEQEAHSSIRVLAGQVPFGWIVRNIHHWAANGILLSLAVHTLRVFFTGAYARPRDVNWMVGMGLFVLMCAFSLTGALLPWTSTSFWSTVYWTDLLGRIPLVGHWLLLIVRGGEEVSGATLTRFFAMHVAVLPMASAALMAAHFAIIRKLGVSEPL